jgi:hypothetical protein
MPFTMSVDPVDGLTRCWFSSRHSRRRAAQGRPRCCFRLKPAVRAAASSVRRGQRGVQDLTRVALEPREVLRHSAGVSHRGPRPLRDWAVARRPSRRGGSARRLPLTERSTSACPQAPAGSPRRHSTPSDAEVGATARLALQRTQLLRRASGPWRAPELVARAPAGPCAQRSGSPRASA